MDVFIHLSKTAYMYKLFQHFIRLRTGVDFYMEPGNLWPWVHLKTYFLVIYVDLCCVLGTGGAVDIMTGTALT